MTLDVKQWLEWLGLEDFARNDVDGELLPRLTSEDLSEIGVHLVGPRRRLLEAVRELEAPPPAAPDGADASETASRCQVTVLFADISGFTELSRIHDAEEVHARLNAFFKVADEIVTDHGAAVDKHIGDAVMSVFGAPVAHTDDPERALRAARAIHDEVARLEPPLDIYIGVASSQVLASTTGSAAHVEYTVTGDSVNLAARLTDLATPGETLVSPAVHRALGHRFIGVNLGERRILGLPAPIAVWRLDGIGQEEDREQHRFVGRGREKRLFANAMDSCQESGTGETLVLRGEAGIGKTRLLTEFVEQARRRGFQAHTSLVLDFGAAKGQDVIPALVRSLLDLPQGGKEAVRARAAREAGTLGLIAEEDRPHLNDLLDVSQPDELEQIYQAMDNAARVRGRRDVVTALIRRRAEQCPLLLAIEDIHRAAPEVRPYLAAIVTCVAECPAVLLMTTRIEGDPLDEARRAAGRPASRHEAALDSLAAAAAGRLEAIADVANIHYVRGNVYFPLGRIDDCLKSCELAIGAARRAGSNSLQVGALSNFGDANYLRGRMATARDDYTQAIDLSRAHGLPRDLAANLHNRGPAHLFCGNLATAISDCEESARLARRLSVPLTEAVALGSMTWAIIQCDELDQAAEAIGRAHEISLRVGARRFEGQFLSEHARVLARRGDVEAARPLAAEAAETALENSRHFVAPKCLSLLARLTPDLARQRELLDQGAAILAEGCVAHNHFFFYPDAMEIMHAQRDWDEMDRYADALEDFTRDEPLAGIDFPLRRCRLAARLGRGERDGAAVLALRDEARLLGYIRQARLLTELSAEAGA